MAKTAKVPAGYVICKNGKPLKWMADDETRWSVKSSNLMGVFVFLKESDAKKVLAKVPDMFEFDDDAGLSIEPIAFPKA